MAPNHIFVEKEIENKLNDEKKICITSFYGNNPTTSENLSKLEKKQFSATLKILKR